MPAAAAEVFETAFRRQLPSQCRAQPDLLFQLVTLISPTVLRRYGVPVFQAVQNRGEFVITFPGVYHGGFNHGALPCEGHAWRYGYDGVESRLRVGDGT